MSDTFGSRIDTRSLERVERIVSAKIGMRPSPSLRDRAIRALELASRRHGAPGVEHALDAVEAGGDAYEAFVDDVAVGETYFFREPEQLAYFRDEILPPLVADPDRPIRVWSAGCSSGEEPYSLAILIAEAGALDRAFVLGTDVSRAALARAREATYRPWSLRGDGAAWARPYLRETAKGLRLDAAIRYAVLFEQLNLAHDPYPSAATNTWGMDVIFCRNVLYYFDAPTIARVVERLAASLVDGGWLVLSASDPLVGDFAPLDPVVTGAGLLYRKRPHGEPAASVVAPPERPARPVAPQRPRQRPARPAPPRPRPTAPAGAISLETIRDLAAAHGTASALEAARNAVARDPIDVELQFLLAVLLDDAGRPAEAADALRRVLYLDHTLAVAHYRLGLLLYRQGDREGAIRSLQNALRVARAARSDEPLPLGEGERAGTLADAAAFQIRMIEDHERA
jgi:chemotaxis protein methyltransferase CheR